MPSVSYYLSTTGHPIDENHPLWHRPLPDNRLYEVKETESITYGSYFSAVSNFCTATGYVRIVKAASRKLEQPVTEKDLGHLSIFLEKHGAFYHPARLQVEVKAQTLSFVINVAASNHGRRALAREVLALGRLNEERPFGWFPQVYDFVPGETPMLLGDWFDDFHEFHLTRQSNSNKLATVVWDGASARSLLTRKQEAGIYRNAAMILTACYDPITSCQIFPWHHAAGDFVVRVEGEGVTVRLITVRDYVPMAGTAVEFNNERAILDALMVFFTHLSVRMRLDRLDGVNEVAWASDGCLAPMVEGFFQGLDLTARICGFAEALPKAFRQYFNHHDKKKLSALAHRIAETVFDQHTEERRVVNQNLVGHIDGITRLLAA